MGRPAAFVARSVLRVAVGNRVTPLKETWIWALVSDQPDPQDHKVEWHASRVQGDEPLAVRASRKLVQQDALLTCPYRKFYP